MTAKSRFYKYRITKEKKGAAIQAVPFHALEFG